MSFFQNQIRSFQGDVSSASSKLSQKRSVAAPSISRPSPAPSTSSTTSTAKPDLKRKRPETSNVIYSQPADTGTGRHLMTQVTYAVEYLKTKDKPISFQDIFNYLSVQDIDDNGKRALEHILKGHSKVDYDPKGFAGKGSFRFRPTHNVRSADDLHAFLQQQPTAQGILVKELKDGWSGALDAIDTLEAEGKLLVTRNKKDDTPRMLWPNDPSLTHPVDKEFQDLWHKVKLPAEAADLRKELLDFGLTPTSQVKASNMLGKGKDKKKKAARKGGKTTNTHMQAILKDYSHMRPVK